MGLGFRVQGSLLTVRVRTARVRVNSISPSLLCSAIAFSYRVELRNCPSTVVLFFPCRFWLLFGFYAFQSKTLNAPPAIR